MQGTVSITFAGEDFSLNPKRSAIPRGPLILPEGVTVAGSLIAFGEDDRYLHCIVSDTGAYYGVFKGDDSDHLYQRLLELNCGAIDRTRPRLRPDGAPVHPAELVA
jgi:hypothetical protein